MPIPPPPPAATTAPSFTVSDAYLQIQSALPTSSSSARALPSPAALATALSRIPTSLPTTGLGEAALLAHLVDDISPGLNGAKTSAHYYGFVTGGVLPIAEAAEAFVGAWDQNVQVHLPTESVSTVVEHRTARLLLQLLDFDRHGQENAAGGLRRMTRDAWEGTFTTGATASNVLGLACGREAVLRKRLLARGQSGVDVGVDGVGELGVVEASRRAGVVGFQVLTVMGHSSLYKASSIVGLGRASVRDVGSQDQPWKFDRQKLEMELGKEGMVSIVVVSCGEVNTGRFATSNREEMERIRDLCDFYGAWLHVDGAFGLFARALPPGDEFAVLRRACEGIELADSITGDAHKCLNVPYDCGFFFTHSLSTLTSVFLNPNAAYLSTAGGPEPSIPSPLHVGIENSRRFRALPVYAVLLAHGRAGLSAMFARQVRLARLIAAFIASHPGYELLPFPSAPLSAHDIGIIVLFRAVDKEANTSLVERINHSGRIYVSGTAWAGRPAARFAISTWKVDEEKDILVIKGVLEAALF